MADTTGARHVQLPVCRRLAKHLTARTILAVITESLAHRVFGNDEAVGKTIKIYNAELAITGVIKDIPENTHIRFEMLVRSLTFYRGFLKNWTSNKGWMAPYTYVCVQPGQLSSIVSKMGDFQAKFYENWDNPGKFTR